MPCCAARNPDRRLATKGRRWSDQRDRLPPGSDRRMVGPTPPPLTFRVRGQHAGRAGRCLALPDGRGETCADVESSCLGTVDTLTEIMIPLKRSLLLFAALRVAWCVLQSQLRRGANNNARDNHDDFHDDDHDHDDHDHDDDDDNHRPTGRGHDQRPRSR